MPLSTATAILCLWLLVIGLTTVHMEVQNVRAGVSIRQLLKDEEASVERLRRLQLEYHGLVRPEKLEKELSEDFLGKEGFPDDGRPVFRVPDENELGADASATAP